MENERSREDALLDFAARLFAIAHSSLVAVGVPTHIFVTGIAAQALDSGIALEDFTTMTEKAAGYAVSFEDAAREAGVFG